MQKTKDTVITFPPHTEQFPLQQSECSECYRLKRVPDNYKNLNKSCSSKPSPYIRYYPDIHVECKKQCDDHITRLVHHKKKDFQAETLRANSSDLQNQITHTNQDFTFPGKKAPNYKNSTISPPHPLLNTTVEIPERQQFQSTVVQWVHSENSSQAETVLLQTTPTTLLPLKTIDEPTCLKRHSTLTLMSKYSKLQWLYIIVAWLTTACGIGIYLYVLTAAFNGNHEILSKNFVLILIVSNVSLLSAVYFHRKMRKFLL